MTTTAGICEAFLGYIPDVFSKEPDRSPAHFDAYLAVSSLPDVTGCEGPITESKILEALRLIGRVNSFSN